MADDELDISMIMPLMMMIVMMGILPSMLGTTTPEPGTGDAGALGFVVKDADGNIIWPITAQTASIVLTPGQVYSVTDVVATNASTKAGVPWPVTLTVEIVLLGTVIGSVDYDFEAGESHTFGPFSFTPTLAQEGLTGTLVGNLKTPAGAVIATVSLDVEVAVIGIDYGGGIVIGSGAIALRLKNAPAGTNFWQFAMYDYLDGPGELIPNIPIANVGVFDALPAGWAFPVLFDILMYELAVSPYNVTGAIQSLNSLYPDYVDINIPNVGLYEIDVAARTITAVATA